MRHFVLSVEREAMQAIQASMKFLVKTEKLWWKTSIMKNFPRKMWTFKSKLVVQREISLTAVNVIFMLYKI